jgi:hypothetical protein
MRIPDLGYLLPHTSSPGSSLFRIRWRRAGQLTITPGPLKLAPLKQGSGRLDLSAEPVAYFAETPETSAYETLARRETVALSLRGLEQRVLLSMATLSAGRQERIELVSPTAPCWTFHDPQSAPTIST